MLQITGAPEEGEGLTWYPVTVEETGDTGYVAAAAEDGTPFIEETEPTE